MKKLFFLLVLLSGKLSALDVAAQKTKKMDVIIASLGNDTEDSRIIAQTIKNDLLFTGQFNPQEIRLPDLKKKKQVTQYNNKAPLFITLSDDSKKKTISWRAYQTNSGVMVSGKKVQKIHNNPSEWAHVVSDSIVKELTGVSGPFASKIVYCKEDTKEKNKTKICVADFDGKNESTILSLDTIALAPRWNGKAIDPLILYSEYTPSNIRLMVTDLKGNKQIATSFDGLNMLPAFSSDGKEVVLCLSVEGTSQIYRYVYNKRKNKPEYTRLTDNEGTNLSPSVLENGDIVFCSDFETKRPQIYSMNKKGKNIKRLSDGGSCTSPAYCCANHKVAYSKLIGGVSQIMVYDFKTEKNTQLTFDNKHKEEAAWSPCGNYMLFTVSDPYTKRLAVESILTKKRNYITGIQSKYTYASWSPTKMFLGKS